MEKYVNFNFVNKRMERKNSYLLIVCIVAFSYLVFINLVTKVPESIPDLILEHGKTEVVDEIDASETVDAYFKTTNNDGTTLVNTIINQQQDDDSSSNEMTIVVTDDAIIQEGEEKNWTGLDWPKGDADFVPLAPKKTLARIVFNDAGKNLNKSSADSFSNGLSDNPEDGDPKRSQGIHIITTFFKGSYKAARFSEIVATLISNLENPHVELVHALWERENPAKYIANYPNLMKKLVHMEVKKQPTYSSMFQYANQVLKRGSVAIITNADIYFDSSLRCLRGPSRDANVTLPRMDNMKGRIAYAVSRRHIPLCGVNKGDHGKHFDLCKDYVHSHDAFIFAPPVSERLIRQTNHPQNRYGAENIVIHEFIMAGYKVFNPCKKVLAMHLHCSDERHYTTSFIDGSNGGTGTLRHGTVWPGTVRISAQKWGWKNAPGLKCGEIIN